MAKAQEAKLDAGDEPPAAAAPAEKKKEAEPFGEPELAGPVDAKAADRQRGTSSPPLRRGNPGF